MEEQAAAETKIAPLEQETAVEQTPVSESTDKPSTSGPSWPQIADDHPLAKFEAKLEGILTDTAYAEVYGIKLETSKSFHTRLILQKFLRANANDLVKAEAQLRDTLKWRKEFQPLKAKDEAFSKKRFDGLGYIITVDSVPESPNKVDIVTFNIYGAVKDNKATFEDIDGFIRWRVGLMELGLAKLNLSSATQPIPDYGKGPDPYQGIQVHDYLNVAFLRQDPYVKAASSTTIKLFQRVYPETLSRKFFVNVPVMMGWMFTFMKLFLSKETVKKFTVLSYGDQLATELGTGIPAEYGGNGQELSKVAEVLKLED